MSEAKIKVSAQDDASRVLADIRASMDRAARGAELLGTALGTIGVAGIAGLAAIARETINGVDALNDLKDATGASIENISALEDIAARTGTSFETVSQALIKFNAQLNEAQPGSAAEQALKALGLSVKDLKQLDPAEALLKTSQALDKFADDADKARLVQTLFGKSVKDVAPLLKDLAEKGALLPKVFSDQANAAEAFNKELFNLQKNAVDASRSLIGPLVESINATIALFREGAKEGKSFYGILVEEQLRMIGLKDGQREYAEQLQSVNKELASGDISFIRRNLLLQKQKDLLQELAKPIAPKDQSAAETARLAGKDKPAVQIKEKPQAVKGPEKDPITDNQRSLASYVQSLQQRSEALDNLTEKQKALNFLQSLGADGEIQQVRELVLKLAEENDAKEKLKETTKRLNELQKVNDNYLEGIAKDILATEQSNQKLREQIEEIGLSKKEMDALTLARMDATIATEEGNLALARSTSGIEEEISAMERKIAVLKETRNLTAQSQVKQAAVDTKADQDKAAKDFADTLHSDLKGAFSAAFRDSKDPLGAFGDALANVMYTRASTALVEALTDNAFNLVSGGSGGGILDSLKSYLPSFDGGGFTGTGGRSGGLDGKGGFLGLLHPQETVLDHTKGQGFGGSSVTVNQPLVINAPNAGPETIGQIQQLMPMFLTQNKRVIEGVIQQAMQRRGGRLSV